MFIEALLIVLIIIVLAGLAGHMLGYFGSCGCSESKPAKTESMVPSAPKKFNVMPGELAALNENAEYFSTVAGDTSGAVHGSENFDKAGATYDDVLTAMAIDGQVVKNHAEFVKDRFSRNNGQNITGRTYSPDSHDSYDPIPWAGLRRPQAVAVSNPTQVPDVDIDLYTNKPVFTWKSS